MSFSIIPPNYLVRLFLLVIVLTLECHSLNINDINEVTYSFRYTVDEPTVGVVSHHWENRMGSHVQGGYSFLDADGRVRVVEYHVDGRMGYKAFVTYRNPPGRQIVGHLRFPQQYRTPIRHAEPVSLITPDLFQPKENYPNLPR